MKKSKFRSLIALISIILLVNTSFIYQPALADSSNKVFIHLPGGNETIKTVQLFYKDADDGQTSAVNAPKKNPDNYGLYEFNPSESSRITKENVQYIKVILTEQVAIMKDGRILEQLDSGQLRRNSVTEDYTREFLAASAPAVTRIHA